jgi:hypothetical protein
VLLRVVFPLVDLVLEGGGAGGAIELLREPASLVVTGLTHEPAVGLLLSRLSISFRSSVINARRSPRLCARARSSRKANHAVCLLP